jgi:hypothetical protein
MEKYVQAYLNNNFEILTSDVGNDGVYLIGDTGPYPRPVYSPKLIKELVLLFSINEVNAKLYVDNWASNVRPEVDLTFYWLTSSNVIFPVLPMTAPTSTLFYLDYAFTGSSMKNNLEI